MKVTWSRGSIVDRTQIFDFIERDNPEAAVRIDLLIKSSIQMLCEFPRIGRAGRVEGTRELVVAGTPYIAVYRVSRGLVRILRVLHGAQQWPAP